MKKLFTILICTLPLLSIASETGGVRETNARISFNGTIADDYDYLSATARFATPISDTLGASLSAVASRMYHDEEDWSTYTYDSYTLYASLFWRDFEQGTVGMILGYSKQPEQRDDTVIILETDTSEYTVYGTKYLGNWSIDARYTHYDNTSKYEDDTFDYAFHRTNLRAAYFLTDNTKLYGTLQYEKMFIEKIYIVGVSHRLDLFGTAWSVSLNHAESEHGSMNFFSLSIALESYGADKSLKAVEREY
jgi:hypothetical protein